ncbi:MAG TPA: MBL fold metallo-hydrolase [Pyrinomonadaceae bacterium]|jgi:L-ascorbate metabolism protein UlaG (beta-lactamase superfamily)
MSVERVYLRGDVLAEPLFNHWYAWSSLISPASSAMFVANSHVKIMQSFVAAPQVHAAANKNPAMRGGPFIDYDPGRVKDIQSLLDQTVRGQARVLEFAADIQRLVKLLASEAAGASLEPLYEKVPESLRGYVELVYDLNHSPSVRFIEGLLYRSPFYSTASQSVSLSRGHVDERPFALSTPQLPDGEHLSLAVPFNSRELDGLFKMKAEPQPLGHARELFGVGDGDGGRLFSSFFTPEPPRPAARYAGEGVRVRYFGHACLLVETKEVSVMIDPLVSYEGDGGGVGRYTYADLPDVIDYVLITHNHQDHCMFETLLQLRHKIGQVVVPKSSGGGLADPSLKLILQNIGFQRVVEIDEMESIEVEGGRLTGLPFLGEHGDLNVRTKIAHLIELKGKSVLCAADSNNIEPKLYDHIHRLVGDVDVLFIGMECDGGPLSWLYGPLLARPLARSQDQSRRLNGSDCRRGMGIVERLRPGQVYVYAMGQEPWLTYLTSILYTEESRPIVESNMLVAQCRERGLESERLFGSKEIEL